MWRLLRHARRQETHAPQQMETAGWLQAGGQSPIGDIRFTTLLMRTPRSKISVGRLRYALRLARSDRTDGVTIAMKPQPEPSAQEVLAGLVERVTYHNAENGFCVLRAKARGHRDFVTVVGHSATIAAGEWITASGEWLNDLRLECGVGFRQLRTCRRTRPGQLWGQFLTHALQQAHGRFDHRCGRAMIGAQSANAPGTPASPPGNGERRAHLQG
jgi:hypothetical protein